MDLDWITFRNTINGGVINVGDTNYLGIKTREQWKGGAKEIKRYVPGAVASWITSENTTGGGVRDAENMIIKMKRGRTIKSQQKEKDSPNRLKENGGCMIMERSEARVQMVQSNNPVITR